MTDHIETVLSLLTEEEVNNLNSLYTEETGKHAESPEALLSQLNQDDIDVIQERFASYESYVNNTVSYLSEDEVSVLSNLFEEETGKQAEFGEELLSMLSKEDEDILQERLASSELENILSQLSEEEQEQVASMMVETQAQVDALTEEEAGELLAHLEKEASYEKIAEENSESIDKLSLEVYDEMQKDAGFADALRAGVTHIGKHAPAYGIGALAGAGMWNQHRINKASEQTRENLARMMAAETAADIATDQVFDKRDKFIIGRQSQLSNQLGQQRSAIIALANIMKKQGVTPEKVKEASMGAFVAKAGKYLGKAKGAAVKAKDSTVKVWTDATGGAASKGVQTKARKSIAKGTGLVAGGAVIGSALSGD